MKDTTKSKNILLIRSAANTLNATINSLKNEKSGMWRYLNKSESNILGSSYDIRGNKTFAPYKVKIKDHWTLKDTNLNVNSVFGFNKLNSCIFLLI